RRVFVLTCLLAAGCERSPEILWDRWGVPHVYAANEPDLFRAFGYAQMRSHGNLLLQLYGQARGRAAEYWGEEHIAEDVYVRTMGIPARAAEWYGQQEPAFRANLDAFADGVNRFAREHADELADSLEVVLPITAADILAHTQRVIHFTFVYGIDRVIGPLMAGSNTWAIGPSRSASGHAMLLANPHLPWADLFLFYEAHLVGPGIDLYGTSLVGFPGLAIAFNPSLGWSHTVNTYDGADLFQLTPAEGGYLWDGQPRPFESATQTLRIRGAEGQVRDTTITIQRSVHGPVISAPGEPPVAVRVAGLDQPGVLAQWWAMGKATSLEAFEAELRRLQIPMFTVMYADRDGHIMHFFGGRVPVRSCCDAGYWAGPVPGDSSARLWSATLPYDQLPRVIDPSSGWLQNANDPPWTTTVPAAFDPDSFPAWISPRFMHFRAQRSARMLMEDSSITFEELLGYKHSTRMELADRLLDPLLAAARRSPRPIVREAVGVLERWDREARTDSRGAVLFYRWVMSVKPDQLFAAPWRPDSALTTPHTLRNPAVAVAALELAAREIQAQYGALDVPYGDVMRLRRNGRDLPSNGAPGDPFGVFRVTHYARDQDGRFHATFGDTYYAAIEFGPTVRAKVLLAYGNSSQPGSPHAGDQLELYSRQEMRDAWLTRDSVEANLELRERVPPED
ncbi:MAG TPA: acylase, partial [Gemmatimonadales bacterium]|nr:acylase [Gemmatimonadales bacterium]